MSKPGFKNNKKQAEAEVVPSSNLVEVEVKVGVEVDVGVEVWGGWLEKVRIKLNST